LFVDSGASCILKLDTRLFWGAGEVEEAVALGLALTGAASMSLGCARAECLSCMVKKEDLE
jgi:hypothetical protein